MHQVKGTDIGRLMLKVVPAVEKDQKKHVKNKKDVLKDEVAEDAVVVKGIIYHNFTHGSKNIKNYFFFKNVL